MSRFRLAVIWVLVFFMTIAIRSFAARNGAKLEASSEESADLQKKLDDLPRKTIRPFSFADGHAWSGRIRAYMFAHDAGLRECRAGLIARGAEAPRALIEISYSLRLNADGVTMQDVIVEKSTLPLSSEEESCVSTEFSHFTIPKGLLEHLPNERLLFSFCFGNLNTEGGT